MTEIPQDTLTQTLLADWYDTQEQLKKVKAKEMLLRTRIFKLAFPDPKEGTNSHPLEGGFVLKGKHSINRTIDAGALVAMRAEIAEARIIENDLVRWSPELKIGNYRDLTEAQLKIFDQCLIIKPGSPALEIVKLKKEASK